MPGMQVCFRHEEFILKRLRTQMILRRRKLRNFSAPLPDTLAPPTFQSLSRFLPLSHNEMIRGES